MPVAALAGAENRRFGLVLAALFVAGCTRVLGIEGDYSLISGDEPAGSGGSAGGSSSGGETSTGGRDGSGATIPGMTGGAAPSAGGTAPDLDGGEHPDTGAPDPCRPGHYTGAFDGSHRPLVTFVGVPATVKTGTVAFDLTGSGSTLSVSGELHAALTSVVVPDAGTFTATLSGQIDCRTRTIKNGQLTGHMEIVNLIPAQVTGVWSGEMNATGAFTGTWTEIELPPNSNGDAGTGPQIGACVPGGAVLIGTGCGTWSTS